LTAKGFDCAVLAPSLVSRQSGNRIKNDRRDSLMLTRLHRAGELTAVCVPHDEDEALRDLTRAREDAKIDEKKAKQRLLAFLLRSGNRYSGRAPWSQAHRSWLADLKMPHRCQQIVLQEYIETLNQCSQRLQRLTDQIRQMVPQCRLFPVVHALQSLRGVSLTVSATTVAEIGDFKRFQNPQQLMSYLGLVPSEHSGGEKTRRGSITKAGNTHVRRMLVEAAWAYRFRARISRALLQRQEALPQIHSRYRLECPGAAVRRLQAPVGQGQDQSGRYHRHRQGTVRLYLGDCHCRRWADGLVSMPVYQRTTIGKRRILKH
jgi:transposase